MATTQSWPLETGPRRFQDGSDGVADQGFDALDRADLPGPSSLATDSEELLSRQEWQLACRVVASKGFSKSEFLPKFLLHVCKESLLERESEITEQRLGVQIFNRPADYNPSEDNIVRSYARLLRKRLDAYFSGEGSSEPMRITIPRGGYIPSFQSISGNTEQTSAAPGTLIVNRELSLAPEEEPLRMPLVVEDEVRAGLDTQSPWRLDWLSGIAGMAIGILLALAGALGLHAAHNRQQMEPAHLLWSQMFQPGRNTLLIPADSGLGILENLTRHQVDVDEYANGTFLSNLQLPPGLDVANFNDLRRQRYTSVVDLDIASRLTKLQEFSPSRTQIRYARSITLEDFKNTNVILLGSKHTNPWVSLFEAKFNFKLEYTPNVDESYVTNTHPIASEQRVYRNGTSSAASSTYGTIAYLPGLDGAGHVLIIQGLNMAATQAAADALFNASIIQPVLQQARMPHGALRPFELLIETTSVGASAPGARIVATRIYP
jgi:hypothetical protein